MSSSERKAIIALREKRGDVHKKAKHDKDKQEIAAIVTQTIASLKTTKGSIFTEASSEEDEGEKASGSSNRNNKALQRK